MTALEEMLVELALERPDYASSLELVIEGHQQYLKKSQERLAAATHEEDGYRIRPSGRYCLSHGARHYANAIKTTLFRLKIDQEALRRRNADESHTGREGAIVPRCSCGGGLC